MECKDAKRHWLKLHLNRVSRELDTVMDFWLKYSHDDKYGGFFNCLGRDGSRYDDLKYGWLQGRQVWMYSRLYNEVERYKKPEILAAAVRGADFLINHVRDRNSGRCYFLLSRSGQPMKLQRQIFTECFFTLGLLELYRAKQDELYKNEAMSCFSQIISWVRDDDTSLGRPRLSGDPTVNTLSIPMIIFSLLDQINTLHLIDVEDRDELRFWCIRKILPHARDDVDAVLENISLDGNLLPGVQGSLLNPGHAIEAGWFLLQEALKTEDQVLLEKATEKFIWPSFRRGWDKEYGGLFYFLDSRGSSPVQLEWSMKLWWPHTEAMVAALMAYQGTGDKRWRDMFDVVSDFCFTHLSDSKYGEWFGYLDRYKHVNQDFKGGPYKGCFHVPRALMMCEGILKSLLGEDTD